MLLLLIVTYFNNHYNVMGLPLFNEEHRLLKFKEAAENIVNNT